MLKSQGRPSSACGAWSPRLGGFHGSGERLTWPAGALIGAVCLAVVLPLAIWVFSANPGRPLNRLLAALLLFEALAAGVGRISSNDVLPGVQGGMGAITALSVTIVPPLYALFLGATLKTPLVRWFSVPAVRRLLYGLCVGAFLFPLAFGTWARGPWPEVAVGIMLLYSLAAAISAFVRAAPSSAQRTQARWFVLAFGTRDVIMAPLLLYTYGMDILSPGHEVPRFWGTSLFSWGLLLAVLLYPPLLTYGILRAQIFDMDLRIKRILSRGTLAGFFLFVFLIASQLAEQWATQVVGRNAWVFGAIAAALFLFAITPLQRFTDRLASAAMPRVKESSDYVAYRKLEVYRAALEGAFIDGRINAKERGMLDRLVAKLGIHSPDANALERDVRGPARESAAPAP